MTPYPFTCLVSIGTGAGVLSWTVNEDDPDPVLADDDDTVLATPVTITKKLAGVLWPAQDDPEVCTLEVVAASAQAAASIVKGAVVRVEYRAGGVVASGQVARFDGRASEVTLTPTRVADGAGGTRPAVRVAVVAVGYLGDLAEAKVDVDTGLSVAPGHTRVGHIFANASIVPPVFSDVLNTHNLKATDPIANGDVWTLATAALDAYVGPVAGVDCRYVIRPAIATVAGLRELAGWTVALVPNTGTVDDLPLPAELQVVDGLRSVVVTPAAADANDPLIDADHVDRALVFRQSKGTDPNTIAVTWWDAGAGKEKAVRRGNGETPDVVTTIASTLPSSTAAAEVAEFYLPDPAPSWGVDSFTWRLYDDVVGRVPPDLGKLVTLGVLDVRHNPNEREWVTGVLTGWTLTIGRRPTATLTLRTARGRIRTAAAGTLTLGSADWTGTFAQLNPRDTFDDYLLVRP